MIKVCDIDKLEFIRKEKKITVSELCDALKMNTSTYYRKIQNGGAGFTVEEIHLISKALNLTDDQAKEIFFVQTVA